MSMCVYRKSINMSIYDDNFEELFMYQLQLFQMKVSIFFWHNFGCLRILRYGIIIPIYQQYIAIRLN